MTGRDLRARSSVMTATEKQQAGSDHLSNHSSSVQRGAFVCRRVAPSSKVRRRSVCHLWQNFLCSVLLELNPKALLADQCFCQRAAANAPVGLGINGGEDRRVGRPTLKTQTLLHRSHHRLIVSSVGNVVKMFSFCSFKKVTLDQ